MARPVLLAVAAVLLLVVAPASGQQPPPRIGGLAMADAVTEDVIGRLWLMTDRHYHAGEYNHIVHLCKVVYAGDPGHKEAFSNAGFLLWSMGRSAAAEAVYRQGLAANPNSFFMYDELGTFFAKRKKDFRRALPYYERAAEFADAPMPTLHMLAHCYAQTNQPEKELATWRRAAKIPSNAVARRHVERLERLLGVSQR
ncbi:MAG TPA: tetratricopeptide repeat protein [Chthonomonadales bacterium]|nr:tetratricopeptide repeat protein [Chthonomonadales bacterium]